MGGGGPTVPICKVRGVVGGFTLEDTTMGALGLKAFAVDAIPAIAGRAGAEGATVPAAVADLFKELPVAAGTFTRGPAFAETPPTAFAVRLAILVSSST